MQVLLAVLVQNDLLIPIPNLADQLEQQVYVVLEYCFCCCSIGPVSKYMLCLSLTTMFVQLPWLVQGDRQQYTFTSRTVNTTYKVSHTKRFIGICEQDIYIHCNLILFIQQWNYLLLWDIVGTLIQPISKDILFVQNIYKLYAQ